jgi:hypothetical protein
MDAQMLEATLKAHLTEMRQRLDQAAGIARAVEACADSGNVEKAVEIALDVEQLIYEVNMPEKMSVRSAKKQKISRAMKWFMSWRRATVPQSGLSFRSST